MAEVEPKYKLHLGHIIEVETKEDGTEEENYKDLFDISTLAHSISYTTALDGSAGKFSFSLEKDPNDILEIQNGDRIFFWYDDEFVFSGRVFSISTDSSMTKKIVAYDLLRYLKNTDSYCIGNGQYNLNSFFAEICKRQGFSQNEVRLDKDGANLPNLPNKFFNKTTIYEMLSWAMTETLRAQIRKTEKTAEEYDEAFDKEYNGEYFFIRAESVKLVLSEIGFNYKHLYEKEDPYVIGDESLLTDFNCESAIGDSTYNEIVVVGNLKEIKNKKTEKKLKKPEPSEPIGWRERIRNADGTDADLIYSFYEYKKGNYNPGPKTLDFYEKWQYESKYMETVEIDPEIKKDYSLQIAISPEDKKLVQQWGRLRKAVEMKGAVDNEDIAQAYASNLQKIYAKLQKTLRIDALGLPLYAGDSFYLNLSKLKIDNVRVYITAATHNYDNGIHTMSLNISTNPEMLEVF